MTSLASFRRQTSWLLLGLGVLVLFACHDLLVNPAERHATGLAVTYQLTSATAARNPGSAFDQADRARVRLMRGTGTVLDTILPFTPAGETRLRVEVPPVQETLTLVLELRRGEEVLFRGTQSVQVRTHEVVEVVVPIAAVPARVEVPDSIRLTSLGDTVELRGAALFATGDTVPDVALAWATLDAATVALTPAGRLVSLANGVARVVGSAGELSDTMLVRVEQVVATVTVTPNVHTVLVGTSAPLAATAADARGASIAAANVFVWSSGDPLIAVVDVNGLVTGVSAGQTTITATRDGVNGTAQVIVEDNTPPQVAITSPADGSTWEFAQPVAFTGTATDRGQPLEGAALVWTSSAGGALGSGSSITKDDLSVGVHTITLTATGSTGLTASHSVQIVVTEATIGLPEAVFVPLGGTVALPIQLSRPAPAGGVTLSLASDATATVRVVTPTLAIAAGEVNATGELEGLAPGTANITVTSAGTGYRAATAVASTGAAPRVQITSPATASTFEFGQAVSFAAATTPAELPSGSTFAWTSSLDGAIGTDASFAKSDLSLGSHTIRLTLTGPGFTTSDSVQIVIGEASITAPASLFVPLGGSGTLAVQLSQPAPAGGVTIAATSDDAAIVAVRTPSLTIPAGETTATATVDAAGSGSATVTFAAMSPGYRAAASRVSTTANLALAPATLQYEPLFAGDMTVALESSGAPVAAPAGGVTVTLAPADGACVAAPATVTIPAGQTSVTAALTYGGSATLPCSTTITASSGAIEQAVANVTVNALPQVSITSPAAGSARDFAQMVTFAGNTSPAVRPEASFVWASSLDGQIGTGPGFSTDLLSVGTHTITLTVTGNTGVTSSSSIEIVVNESSISVPTTLNVPYTRTASLPVQLSRPAPTGGLTLSIVSSDPSRVTVQTPTLFIAAGQSTANATVEGTVPGSATITVTGTPAGYRVATTQVTTTASLVMSPRSITYDAVFPGQVTVRLESAGAGVAAPAGGIGVVLTALNPACAAVTSPVTIQAGLVSATATLTYGGSATLPCTTSLVAESGPIRPDTIALRVNPPPQISAGTFPVVGSGLQTGMTSSANLNASNHGGVVVTIRSSNPQVALVSPNTTTPGSESIQVNVLQGVQFFNYVLQGVEGATGSATITVSAPQFIDGTTNVTVVQPAYQLGGVQTSTTTFSGDNAFFVQVGIPNGQQTALSTTQVVRPGGTPLTANLTTSNTDAALLVTSSATGAAASVQIQPGQSNSPFSVATGGAALRPAGSGTTTVAAQIDNLIAVNAATTNVTVTAPTITAGTFPTVGSGLQTGMSSSVNLGANNHGGTTVTVTSSDPTVALVSPNTTTAGAASIEIPVSNGTQFLNFVLQGVERATGTATLTVSAPGFNPGTTNVNVVQAAYQIGGLTTSTTTLSGDNAFFVQVGVANGQGTALSVAQNVRAGATPLTVSLTNQDDAVAEFITTGANGQEASVLIQPGQSNSPFSVAAGGVALRPLGPGTTTVTAQIADLRATNAATVNVAVSAPVITAGTFPQVGSGLQTGMSSSVNLGANNHGGVLVTIRSSNPQVALVSPNTTTPGSDSIQVQVANGTQFFTYVLQGVENAAGTSTISVSAPGFVTGNTTATVVQAAYQIGGLSNTTTTLSGDNPFFVQVGVPNSQRSALTTSQNIRAGGTALTVNVSNSEPLIAQLVTSAGVVPSGSVQILPGQSNSPFSVAAGGIALRPRGAGTTIVTADIGGLLPTHSATDTVVVSAPGISAGTVPNVGSGLQTSLSNSGNLGASNHGGVDVIVRSSNPQVALISPNATTAGADSIVIRVNSGSTFFSYVVQGVEGATGTVTVTASAPGFVDGTTTATVVQPGFSVSLPPTTTTQSGDQTVTVSLGVPNAQRTSLVSNQALRIGASALSVSLGNSNGAVGQLVTSAGAGQNAAVQIQPGQFSTASTVAAGGVAFRPISAGGSTVTAAIDGFIPATGSDSITVSVPGINAGNAQTVGAALQTSSFGSLGASQHGGTVVTLRSSNPQVLLLSPNSTTPGSASIQINLNNGASGFSYFVQGVEGATGSADVIASAAGFNDGSWTTNVVQAAYQIINLPTTLTAGAADRPFQVQVGLANSQGTALTTSQVVRAGGSALVVNLASSNAEAGPLVTSAGPSPAVSVQIQPGQATSPGSVATGGVALRPATAGSTTVTSDIALLRPMTAAAVTVVVQ